MAESIEAINFSLETATKLELRWGGKFSIEKFIFPIILRFSNSMSGRFVQKIMFSGGKRGNPALIDERGQGFAML